MSAVTQRSCPAECGQEVENGHLLCWDCWWGLPQQNRVDVNRALRTYRSRDNQKPAERIAAALAYRAASDTAISLARARVIKNKVRPVAETRPR